MEYYLLGCELDGRSGYEAGRALLASLYETHVGGPLPDIRIAPRGKPYLAESSWHFSVTHTKRHAFCALARRPIGIDAEELDRPVRLQMAEKLLSAGEYAQFAAAPDPQLAFLTFWVLKEADAKRTGEGIRFHPNTTDYSLDDPRVHRRDGCLIAVSM